jgi:D-xylose transport system substrate-binding protein
VALLLVIATVGVLLAGRGLGGLFGPESSGQTTGVHNGKNCKHTAFLLPYSIERWETADRPDVVAAIQRDLPGATIDSLNADGNADTQQEQAESELARGACILIVAAADSTAAAAIVTRAKQANVPVIAYESLIYSDELDFYASFNDFQVGQEQGRYIAAHYQQYVQQNGTNNLIMIKGFGDDYNSHQFSDGVHSVLDPLLNSGALKNAYEQYTSSWDPATAELDAETALTQDNNKVAVAYVVNDAMAGAVIAALSTAHLNGKVLVTGQDANAAAVRNILLGEQTMTVYKPIKTLADSVGSLVAAISTGQDTSSIATGQVKNPYGRAQIASVLNAVTEVDISNINATVIADGFLTPGDICIGVPSGAGGVCP